MYIERKKMHFRNNYNHLNVYQTVSTPELQEYSYFLKSPIGSLVLALTIFKSSFKYLSLMVISSLLEFVASLGALLEFSASAAIDVDCAISSTVVVVGALADVELLLVLLLLLLLAKELNTVSLSDDGLL